MTLWPGQNVLHGRYRLLDAPLVTDNVSVSWPCVGPYDTQYLIKAWPFDGDTPDEYKRALWDAELRTMYRVGSSPGAEETILAIRDAGLDRDAGCFIMVLEATGSSGYSPLSDALRHRGQFGWLSNQDAGARRELWQGLQHIADGLQLLHDQNILHRNLTAEAVLFNPQLGPRSFRLGGFEWSIRLGQLSSDVLASGWSTPPEFSRDPASGYRRETDWYAFGMLAARCLLSIEPAGQLPLAERQARVLRDLDKATARQLSDFERTFVQRLIDPDSRSRLARGYEARMTLKDIIACLGEGTSTGNDNRPLVVVINPASASDLIEYAQSLGFVPNPDKPNEMFSPGSVVHVTNLTNFIQQDMVEARLLAVPKQRFYLLAGQRMTLLLYQGESTDQQIQRRVQTWEFAFCSGPGEIRGNDGGSACRELPEGAIVVRTARQLHTDSKLRQGALSWEQYLPTIDRVAELRASLARFHDFIRCTNQLELLIRDAEVFRYEIVREEAGAPGWRRIFIRQAERERRPAPWCELEGGLAEYLQREIDSGKQDCRSVLLAGPNEDGLTIERQVPRPEFWEVKEIQADEKLILLERSSLGPPLPPPPAAGTLRTFGMFGQISLIRRRKRAIDRLEKHSYLLRSLSAPGQVYMDTGAASLFVPLPPEKVDEAKQAVMRDILRVRPIYALQGPPGTGKTTLVSHLVRQILADDSVAQVLITAQAHGAVDVLRAKVRDESFQGVEQPLAVRLGTDDAAQMTEGSVPEVSLRVLEEARSKVRGKATATPLQADWLRAVDAMIEHISSNSREAGAGDFCELVRRGASLTYCTTSAADLEDLADGAQSFDWSIVEEAGKAHGFDLALPLQAGHRWLLIGDPNQLPPYRFEDYQKGIERLDEAVDWLEKLPAQSRNLLDMDWIRAWRDRDPDSRRSFVEYAKEWLNAFKRILQSCRVAIDASDRRTIDQSNGSMAGLLSRQYRMHPTIGDLISAAYYDDELVNRTIDAEGHPKPEMVHPFVAPKEIAGKAIVWLDVPWAAREPSCEEQGPRTNQPRYRNRAEAQALRQFLGRLSMNEEPLEPLSLAVLSPYNQQVTFIRNQMRGVPLPAGVIMKPNLRTRRRRDPEGDRLLAHTVDSFQGNEADIIVVSLVRNNTLPLGDPSALGFLKDAARLNVLLSRAERLLVLIGSWEFFKQQVAHVPLDDRRHELWHWKKVMTLLEEWFSSGKAARLSVAPPEAVS